MSHDEGRCRSCGAPIVWISLLPSAKPHPVDSVPSIDGTIEVRRGRETSRRYGKVIPEHERAGRLYVSHFATCPNASSHRKGRR